MSASSQSQQLGSFPTQGLLVPVLAGQKPAWELATLFPNQGAWTEDDYLDLDLKRCIELVDGQLVVLPMPSFSHEFIIRHLYHLLSYFVRAANLGEVFFAGIRVRPRQGCIRMPDISFISKEKFASAVNEYSPLADLVIEVVSPDSESHRRDYEKKRADYASGHYNEYWIVDPELKRITVLVLNGDAYDTAGEYGIGESAASSRLEGFKVDVAAVFDAATFKD